MKIGTYFAYWAQEWKVDYFPYIEKAKKAGFDVLEISSGILDLRDDELTALKNAAKDAGLTLTACLGVTRDMDVSSADEVTRRKGIDYLKRLFIAMDKADIRKLGGIIYAYWPCDYSQPVDKPAVRARSIKSVQELADDAAQYGIELEMEVVNRFEHFLLNDAKEAVQYVKDVGRPNVKVMLDCFHMNIEEDNMGDAIRYTGEYLGHFHIGETNRKVPGKGRMPWDEMAQALRDINYQGYVVMEPFVKMGGGVGSDIKVWRDLSDNADEAQLDADIAESVKFLRTKFY
ncbi:MAG: sugar phosphate isomerase/epimerase [Christensenellaceae bacterium]|nr:sugar phosphate isomerase/epimerase [Christensenellaceae bacterium]